MAIVSYEYFQRRFGSNPLYSDNLNKGKPLVRESSESSRRTFRSTSRLANLEAAPDIWIANRSVYDAAQRILSHARDRQIETGITIGRAASAPIKSPRKRGKIFSILNTAGYVIRVEPMRQHLVSEVARNSRADGPPSFFFAHCMRQRGQPFVGASFFAPTRIAIRSAIGAVGGFARQILSEALLLAAIGVVGGLGIAWLGIHELLAIVQSISRASIPSALIQPC